MFDYFKQMVMIPFKFLPKVNKRNVKLYSPLYTLAFICSIVMVLTIVLAFILPWIIIWFYLPIDGNLGYLSQFDSYELAAITMLFFIVGLIMNVYGFINKFNKEAFLYWAVFLLDIIELVGAFVSVVSIKVFLIYVLI